MRSMSSHGFICDQNPALSSGALLNHIEPCLRQNQDWSSRTSESEVPVIFQFNNFCPFVKNAVCGSVPEILVNSKGVEVCRPQGLSLESYLAYQLLLRLNGLATSLIMGLQWVWVNKVSFCVLHALILHVSLYGRFIPSLGVLSFLFVSFFYRTLFNTFQLSRGM